ncbi:hypothetical protein [Tabrizicola fusiformis]|uniref:hypothetical protein n=1 Tax=Tabrizicola sp. SY72 TaxID=2741673 RepID=UPI001572D547|nr:hypothetical protein [Tabrizicola sp. SY72]NTT86096.1 hypothetical protein [Tabrizicola sp. SY72]
MAQLIFIGTDADGFTGGGKQERFIQVAAQILPRMGVEVRTVRTVDEIAALKTGDRTVAALVYSEGNATAETYLELEDKAEICHEVFSDLRLLHHPDIGQIIKNKAASADLFEKHKVPTPRRMEGSASSATFSNSADSSGAAVSVFEIGDELPEGRFNTEFVDTRHEFRGASYYVSLRAVTVGGKCLATYVRCRPVEEGNPSVHAKNTPRQPGLINYLMAKTVLPNQEEITEVCARLGTAFGPGFYAHDILPSCDGKGLFVCETGFKFDESSLRRRLRGLEDRVAMPELFNDMESIKRAYAIAADPDFFGV